MSPMWPRTVAALHGAQARQGGQRGEGHRDGLARLGFVVLDLPVQSAQVGQQVTGYVPAAVVGGGDRPDDLYQGGSLVGRQAGGCSAGQEVVQDGMEPVEDAGPLVDQVVSPLGPEHSVLRHQRRRLAGSGPAHLNALVIKPGPKAGAFRS
ncbi:hypothetical protein OHA98_20730 [Streptomyces sp. NBC_00654]|uniref:hypothetical protein n=1 Tax=Streptomyces sp. NBC_00654 TaxID=2975799 RepID=UPI002254566C|nr:hypothetical protein [Streptomyces sp. NBC_00654]MCX4967166.1 hypothetical protein [Streptomyces sp. NBC_00654]